MEFTKGPPPCFNSRPRAAGDWSRSGARRTRLFQLTPARSGRRKEWSGPADVYVSTHARAQRATPRASVNVSRKRVSTHARAQRATAKMPGSSRPKLVSTHARAQRATPAAGPWPSTCKFQLTPARSGRRKQASTTSGARQFQLTPARSGRLAVDILSALPGVFQLTPARSGRLLGRKYDNSGFVSTHARAQRATGPDRNIGPPSLFQLTPARSGRPSPCMT